VRLIDENGKQVGVVPLKTALGMAIERNLDLVQVTEKISPPVCKIIEYGKYLYQLKKKEKKHSQHKGGEVKGVRINFNTSLHDLETKAFGAIEIEQTDRRRPNTITIIIKKGGQKNEANKSQNQKIVNQKI
jgi:translation initiation factor IF-3